MVPFNSRSLRLIFGGLTAFVVTVVVLIPFVDSQSRSISSGERFWSIGTIGAGVLAVVAVGAAAGLVRSRTRTAALVAGASLLLELPGLYDKNFESLSPAAAGVALGAITLTIPRPVRAATVAGVLVAVFTSDTLLDPNSEPRQYADYLTQDITQFQPPLTVATASALVLTLLSILVFWNHDADRSELREPMSVTPVVVTGILTLLGVALNWWIEINTALTAIPVLAGALAFTVIAAFALRNGGRVLLISSASAATLASVVANSLSPSVTEVAASARVALVLGVIIVAAAALAVFFPSVTISYGLLIGLTVAGLASYAATQSPPASGTLSISDALVVVAGGAAAYAMVSAMQSEPPRTGASRLLVGLGVIFGPTAFALLVYPQFSYGWTDYSPISGAVTLARFERSNDVLILGFAALVIVVVCAYSSRQLHRVNQSGPSTPNVEIP